MLNNVIGDFGNDEYEWKSYLEEIYSEETKKKISIPRSIEDIEDERELKKKQEEDRIKALGINLPNKQVSKKIEERNRKIQEQIDLNTKNKK